MARPGDARRGGADKPGDGALEVAAFADAGRDRGAMSTGATPQTSATKRSDFHLAQSEKIRFKKNSVFADT